LLMREGNNKGLVNKGGPGVIEWLINQHLT
jgi:hypothetical protein